MKLSINQPQYLPYIGFFHKLMLSDVHVILDDVQFIKNGFEQRNRIKGTNGPIWLTIPSNFNSKSTIKNVEIDNKFDWKKEHFKSIVIHYNKSPYFQEHKSFFEEIYSKEWKNLTEFTIKILKYLKEQLNIPVKFVRSSELNINTLRTQKIIDICKKFGADTYVSGPCIKPKLGENQQKILEEQGITLPSIKQYSMDENLFKENSIKLVYQEFNHPVYNQKFGVFIPYMSIIDLLFNHGKESIDIIKNSGSIKEV